MVNAGVDRGGFGDFSKTHEWGKFSLTLAKTRFPERVWFHFDCDERSIAAGDFRDYTLSMSCIKPDRMSPTKLHRRVLLI